MGPWNPTWIRIDNFLKKAYLAQEEFEVKEFVLQHEMKEVEGLTKKREKNLWIWK